MPALKTTHNLPFEVADYPDSHGKKLLDDISMIVTIQNDDPFPGIPWKLYRVGTVEGQWRSTPEGFEILSFHNSEKGNGHLDDVFEWFEFACKREGISLKIRELMNPRFKKHLIKKRAFQEEGKVLIKTFDQMIDEINAQAREIYSLGAVARETQIPGNIKTIVKVGYAPVQDQMLDLRRYFIGKGLDPERTAIDRMKINGITIKVVNASKRNWTENIKGFSNFIKP